MTPCRPSHHGAWHDKTVRETGDVMRAVEAAAASDGFGLDAGQHALVTRLARLATNVDRGATARSLYIHGDAGRGKSWLAAMVFDQLATIHKTRVHFHGFFDELHRSIHQHRGENDAVERAIDDITGDSRLLFFDEFHVHDSGDARLFTRLLDHVFARGMTVLATSNYAPDDLLPNPVWHELFAPGIALIKANMDVWHLAGPIDYRTVRAGTARGFAAGTWSTGPTTSTEPTSIRVNDRLFEVTSARDGELVATFQQLCGEPLATIEYLHWARTYPRWRITDIPAFETALPDAQQRFINLIDVVADAGVPVHFSASVDLPEFLEAVSKRPDAFRMVSRLSLLAH